MHDLFKELIDWYLRSLETGGYAMIVLLMFIESTFLPLPSELIIPPAAHLAYTKGNMSLLGIGIAGAIGSWLGATTMYWISRWAGRPLILKFGKYFLVPPDKVKKNESWACRFASSGALTIR